MMFLLRKKRRIVVLLVLVACIVIPLLVWAPWSHLSHPLSTVEYAEVVNIGVVENFYPVHEYWLVIYLEPTDRTQVDETYIVELWENGELRGGELNVQFLEWTEPELNVQATKEVRFSLTQHEGETYLNAYDAAVTEAILTYGILGKEIWEYPGFRSPLMDIFDAKILTSDEYMSKWY